MAVRTKMIVGAGALSRKKLTYDPKSIENIHIKTEAHSIVEKRRTRRNALAPGAISNPIASIRPTEESVATIVNASAVKSP